MALTLDGALAALRKVMDPELHRDLVSLGMVKDLAVEGGRGLAQGRAHHAGLSPARTPSGGTWRRRCAPRAADRVNLAWGAQVRIGARAPRSAALTPGVKNIVLVGAGKGGVGKSTVAINLARGARPAGGEVGILDADIYGPSLADPDRHRPASRSRRTGSASSRFEAHGLKAMSIGFLVDPDQALVWRGPMVTGALIQLLRDVNWGELDYLVLDLPPGTGDVPLTLAQNVRAAGVVLVSTPQDVALADVIRAKLMFDKVGHPRAGDRREHVLASSAPTAGRRPHIFDHGGARTAAEKMGIRFLGEIPLDLAIREGGDRGLPVVAGQPDEPAGYGLPRRRRSRWPAR